MFAFCRAHEEVAGEDRRPDVHEPGVNLTYDPGDAARVEPPRVERAAPQSGVAEELVHYETVVAAELLELVRRDVPDVVRVRRALGQVREATEQEPEAVAPVAGVRLHPDERAAALQDAKAFVQVVLEIEQMLQIRVADD